MNGRLGIRGFLGTVGLVFGLTFAGTLLLPHDPYIRYQSFNGTIFARLGGIYERLAFDKTPIDVLVVGSSRSARGVDATAVEAALAAKGHPAHVANISLPAAGFDIRLTKIREALAHHKIKLLIFGLTETLPRDGHQSFGQLGSVREILSAPWIVNRTLPVNLAALPYREMELAVATLVPEAFGYHRSFDPGQDSTVVLEPEDEPVATSDPTAHAEALATESRMRRRTLTKPILPESLSWIEFGVSQTYVRELVKLAEENDVKLVFLFMPFYQGYDMPLDAAWLEQFGPIWTPDFVKSDPEDYSDAAHMSPHGRTLITPWISGLIDNELENLK